MAAVRLFLLLGLLWAPATWGQNYDTVIFTTSVLSPPDSGGVLFYQSATHTVVTFYRFAERTRGGAIGPKGLVYVGLWLTNGVAALDPKTGSFVKTIADSSNRVLGAPYGIAPDHEAVGGFGVSLIDGNLPPAPAPTATRNTARVNFGTNTFRLDGWFPNTETDNADFFPDPFRPGGFVGVPRWMGDLSLNRYPLAANPPQAITVTTLAVLGSPCHSDACWAEDGQLYLWGNHYMGMHVVDLRRGSSTLVPVKGIYAPTDAALWPEPWEKPGLKAFIVSGADDRVYALDLLQFPIVAVSTKGKLPVPVTDLPYAASSVHEAQLLSWWTGKNQPGVRTFHLNFGPAYGGATAILLPSLRGHAASPLRVHGLEIYLRFDAATTLALAGALPYPAFALLDKAGQATILWRGFGAPLGLDVSWQAYVLAGGVLRDASNLIRVRM